MSHLTKKAITETFVKLLNERPLDKITIKDIVEECGINRNTFYYHFQDIYALLEYIFEEEASQIVKESNIFVTWQEGFLKSTSFAMKNKNAIYHVYNSIRREQLERYLLKVTDNLMMQYVYQQSEGFNVSEDDIKLLAIFYKHALVGITLAWLQNGMKEDPESIISQMGVLFDGSIRYSLEKASKNGLSKVKTQ